jgi:hypothetical protein
MFFTLLRFNPQFFREFKGRLTSRSLALTAAASLLGQALLMLYFWVALPDPGSLSGVPLQHPYCTGKGSRWRECAFLNPDQVLVNWQAWWLDIFQVLSWTLPLVVLVAGVYMLIGDITKEERRGTLNFIRLSPQPSQRILRGKLLGVPLLPWIAVLLAVPLHLMAAVGAGMSAAEVVTIYLVTIVACACFYTAAIFYGFMEGSQGWFGAVGVLLAYTFVFQLWATGRHNAPPLFFSIAEWFRQPIGTSLIHALGFALLLFVGLAVFLWRGINRRFRNPNLTLLSKAQSYLMTFSFELFMLGFMIRSPYKYDSVSTAMEGLGILMVLNVGWFMVMIGALTPHRQSLLDWARYRHAKPTTVAQEKGRSGRRMWSDLLWGDRSPAMLAIAVNWLLVVAVLLPWIVAWSAHQLPALVVIVLTGLFMLVCAAIAQLVLFSKSNRRAILAAAILGILVVIPPLFMGIANVYPQKAAIFWLVSAIPVAAWQYLTWNSVMLSVLGYCLVLGGLTLRLKRQLHRAGESELKMLLASCKP